MSKIKVLHVHTRAVIGGSGANTLLTMAGLDRNRFQASLACGASGPLLDEARKKDLKVEVIQHLDNAPNVFKDSLALIELIRLIKREKFDLVHTHNSKAGILGRVAAKYCAVRVILHTQHSCVFLYPNLNIAQRKFYLYLEKLTAMMTDKIIAISEPIRKEFIKARVASPDKFTTIYSGIETEKFKNSFNPVQQRQQLKIAPEEFVVGTVGRLAPGKGGDIFLQAAAQVIKQIPRVKFIIVGDGPLRQNLESLSQQLGLGNNCIFTGLRQDVEKITPVFDVAVLASLYEGMGRVLLEAQACGRPVVATRVGGIPDIVDDQRTGFLVPVLDSRALAGAIIKLLSDDTLRQRMGLAAAAWVSAKFSSQNMVEQITQLYEQLLDRKGIGRYPA